MRLFYHKNQHALIFFTVSALVLISSAESLSPSDQLTSFSINSNVATLTYV